MSAFPRLIAAAPRLIAAAILSVVAVSCDSAPTPRQSQGPFPGESVSTDDALPAEYPDEELPVPEPSTVIYSAVSQFGLSAYFTSPLSSREIKSRMLATIRDREWSLHTCEATQQSPEPTTLIVASRPGTIATVLIGYSPQAADRIGGKRFSFLISIATRGERPKLTADPC